MSHFPQHKDIITDENATTTTIDGVPKAYDTAIDTDYQHSLGTQQGWLGT